MNYEVRNKQQRVSFQTTEFVIDDLVEIKYPRGRRFWYSSMHGVSKYGYVFMPKARAISPYDWVPVEVGFWNDAEIVFDTLLSEGEWTDELRVRALQAIDKHRQAIDKEVEDARR